ncbi:MAG: hypothetical protein IPG50_31255 [Myxococcales bacterium]|nr:hypothetical protein [Myxococcales bacterium]
MNHRLFARLAAPLLVALTCYAGCSSDEETAKKPLSTADSGASGDAGATTQDSGGTTPTDSGTTVTDSATVDTGSGGGKAAQCQAYCACMNTTCNAKMPANCQTACEAQTNWDLSCRTTHCGLAGGAGQAGTHCPHAAGENTCL